MVDFHALYQMLICLLFNKTTVKEAEVRDGKTHEPGFVYVYLCLSVQCLMVSVLGLSWSVNSFVALFFNPMWFIGLQTVHLLLYYEGVYRPYSSHSEESTKGLAFEAHSNLPLEQRKQQAQFRFLFAWFGVFGIDSIFPDFFRERCFPWLFYTTEAPKSILSIRSFSSLKENLSLVFLYLLKLSLRLIISLFETFSFVLSALRFSLVSAYLFNYGAALSMHIFIIFALKNTLQVGLLSVSNVFLVLTCVLTLLSFYRLLSPKLQDFLSKITLCNEYIAPILVADYSIKIRCLISSFGTISSKFSSQLTLFAARMCNSTFHNNWPVRTFVSFVNQAIKCLYYLLRHLVDFGNGDKAQKDESLLKLLDITSFAKQYYELISEQLVNWMVAQRESHQSPRFSLQSRDHHVVADGFVDQIWKPHLSEFLQMQNILLYTDPHIAKAPADAAQVCSPNLAGFDPENRTWVWYGHIDHNNPAESLSQSCPIDSPLRWNRTFMARESTGITVERPDAHQTEGRSGQTKNPTEETTSDFQALYRFFIDHVTEEEAQKLTIREARNAYDSVFKDKNKSERVLALFDYLGREHTNLRHKSPSVDAFTAIDGMWDTLHHKLNDLIHQYREVPQDAQLRFRHHIVGSMLSILENLEKCAAASQDALEESLSLLPDPLLSVLQQKASQIYRLNIDLSSHSLISFLQSNRMIENIHRSSRAHGDNRHGFALPDEPPFAPRQLDLCPLIVFPAFHHPAYFMFVQLLTLNSESQLDSSNRHFFRIVQALHGYHLNSSDSSLLEQASLGFNRTFLQSMNLQSLSDLNPIGHQLQDSLHNKASTNLIFPIHFLESKYDKPSILYREWVSYLTDQGYLREDQSTSRTEERNHQTHLASGLFALVNEQVQVDRSVLRLSIFRNCLLHERGIEPELITWKVLADIVHKLDYYPEYGQLVMIGQRRISVDHLRTYLSDNIQSETHFYLCDPLNYLEGIQKMFAKVDHHTKSYHANGSWEHAKLRCLVTEDNLEAVLCRKKVSPYIIINHREIDSFNKKSLLSGFYANNRSSPDLTPLYAENYLSGLSQQVTKHLHNQIFMPIVLTLLLKEGILYRGADVNDQQRDIVYENAADVSSPKPTHKKRPQSVPSGLVARTRYYSLLSLSLSCALFLSTVRNVFLLLCQILVCSPSLIRYTSTLLLACVSTVFYYVPAGILRERYLQRSLNAIMTVLKVTILMPIFELLTTCLSVALNTLKTILGPVGALLVTPWDTSRHAAKSMAFAQQQPRAGSHGSDGLDKKASNATPSFWSSLPSLPSLSGMSRALPNWLNASLS